ncbi:MAG: type II toxin-antitoxin system VapC family toxin [Acidobacteriota bacterium]
MKTLVLDTSVAAAWYLPEDFSADARRWQQRMMEGRVQLVVPGLHYWEMANLLRTYVRRGGLDAATAQEIYDLHLDAPLDTANPDRAQVLTTALDFDASAYDAVYIALSQSIEAPLLTAERTTTPWVVKLGERVLNVRT